MRDAQVRRLPVVNDMGHRVGAISQSTISCSSRSTPEQAPTQGASLGSMPLVASNGGGEAGRPSRFRNGSDHLFVAALVVSGMRRAGIDLFLQRGRIAWLMSTPRAWG